MRASHERPRNSHPQRPDCADLRDRLDQNVFNAHYARSLVYNICWEDSAVHRRALHLGADDSVMVIPSAGCNALDYALDGPARLLHGRGDLIAADATNWQPQHAVDRVFLSYSLTMMPKWCAVLANAWNAGAGRMAGSGRFPPARRRQPFRQPLSLISQPHTRACRGLTHTVRFIDGYKASVQEAIQGMLSGQLRNQGLWRHWFAHDGAHLTDQHLKTPRSQFSNPYVQEHHPPVSYLPGLRAPSYLFVGAKPNGPLREAMIYSAPTNASVIDAIAAIGKAGVYSFTSPTASRQAVWPAPASSHSGRR